MLLERHVGIGVVMYSARVTASVITSLHLVTSCKHQYQLHALIHPHLQQPRATCTKTEIRPPLPYRTVTEYFIQQANIFIL